MLMLKKTIKFTLYQISRAYFRNLQQALIYLLLQRKRTQRKQYIVEEKCIFMTHLETVIKTVNYILNIELPILTNVVKGI